MLFKRFCQKVMHNSTEPPGMRDFACNAMILVVLGYVLVYVLPLGLRPMTIPDESRYGEIPREMIQSGNWSVPHLVDLRYFEKPPMGYWLNAISISVFGENIFAVRLPGALATGLSAWFIWLLLVRAGYGQRIALVAAVITLSFVEVLVVGTLSVLDNPFTLFLSGGMVLFYLAAMAADASRQQRRYLIASGVMFGLSFLSKGFLAFVLPGLVILPYCLLQKRYMLIWRCWWIALFAILTVLPWAIIIHLREPDYWHYFIFEEHIRRFLAKDAQHVSPFYYYLMLLPVAAFPWLSFVPAAIAGVRLDKRHSDVFRYLLLWFGMPFLFFSISKGKLPTYILPCLIPAGALIAIGLMEYLSAGRRRLLLLGVVLNAALLLIGLAALLYQQFHGDGTPFYQPDETRKLIGIIVGLSLTGLLTLAAFFFKRTYKTIAAIAASVGIIFVILNSDLPDSVLAGKSPVALYEHVAPKLKPDTIIVSDANVVRAVAWSLKRTDIYLLHKGELGYGLSYPEHKQRYIGIGGLKKLLDQLHAGELQQDIAVFCEEPCQPELTALLGHRADQFSNEEFSVWITPCTNLGKVNVRNKEAGHQ